MFPKITVVAALVLFAFLGVAEAQNVEGASVVGRGARAQGSDVSSGWNAFHIAHCLTLADNFYIYPLENIGVAYFFTDIPKVIFQIAAACQTGNLVGIFVTDPVTLGWNQFYTFTFK
jgi:hypothetical protein